MPSPSSSRLELFMHQTRKLFLLIAVLSLSLTACSGKKPEATVNSKEAVKVNGQPILDAEIQTKTAQRGGVDGKQRPVSETAMESLVNMELMHQAAVHSKLDADVNVQAKVSNSIRSILAMAYIEQLLESAKKPTDTEISAYYNQHPERYAERKQYGLQEILIQATPENTSQIKDQLGKLQKLEQFDKWLKESNIPHQSNPVSVLTDRLPDELMQKFKNVPVGGHIVLDSKEPLQVLFLLSEQMQPATLGQVSQQIGNTLFEQRRKEVLDNTLKQLRDKAKIEYVAPYTAKGLQDADTK